MKKSTKALVWVLPLLFAGWLLLSNYDTPSDTMAQSEGNKAIAWMSVEEALRASAKEKKKIYIDLYTDWCGWCKVMDNKTFTDPEVIAYMSAHYYPVKFNAEQKADVVFRGKTYSYNGSAGRRGVHSLAQELTQGQLSYPTSVILDEDLNILVAQPGYLEADKLKHILIFLEQELYKKMSWADYYKTESN